MKNMKQLLALVLALVLALGCAAMAEESPFPFTLTTYMDMEVTFDKVPERVIAANACAGDELMRWAWATGSSPPPTTIP